MNVYFKIKINSEVSKVLIKIKNKYKYKYKI